jgi:predicted DsbA family dithiol-disulfide isomerase
MTAEHLISISIVSDTVCPFCYVGKVKLEKAIAAYETKHPGNGAVFQIEWKPFYLNPSAPNVGMFDTLFLSMPRVFGRERQKVLKKRRKTF